MQFRERLTLLLPRGWSARKLVREFSVSLTEALQLVKIHGAEGAQAELTRRRLQSLSSSLWSGSNRADRPQNSYTSGSRLSS
jgi:hypothetical protein